MARPITAALLLCALLFLAALAVIAACQAFYPAELNVYEGPILEHVRRLRDGLPIYAEPSVDFVAYLYAPGYYWATAALTWLVGIEPPALRLVSIAGTAITLGSLYVLVRRLADWRWGVIAAGFYAACFSLSYGWYALGRVDSLALGLFCLGVAWLHGAGRDRARIAAALAFVAAIWTKQSMAVALAPVLAALVWVDRRALAICLAGLILLLAAPFLAWNAASAGWLWYYLIGVTSSLPTEWQRALRFFTVDLRPFAPSLLLAAWAAWDLRQSRWGQRGFLLLAAGAGMLAAAWVSRWNIGGFVNVLTPAFAALGAAAALACFHLGGRALRLAPVAGLLLIGQFALLVYDPRMFLPDAGAADRAQQIRRELAALAQPAWLGGSGYWLGRNTGYAPTALNDLRYSGDGHYQRIMDQHARRISEGFYASVVLPAYALPFLSERLEPRYRLAGKLGEGAPRLDIPTTTIPGLPVWPYYLYQRR